MKRLTDLVRRLIALNVSASTALARKLSLPSDKPFWQRFERTAAAAVAGAPEGARVVDVGGGRRCVYAQALPGDRQVSLIAVDVSAEELAANRDVAETYVAGVAEGLPLEDGSVDLILSRAVLEHVRDVPAAAQGMGRVLRPGGRALHFVPARYSLFATAARFLPFGPLLALLHRVRPDSRGQVEFEVHYDHCHPAGMERAFRQAGFRDVQVDVCWAAPGYFEPVFPLFVLTSAYEAVVRKLGLRRLASYMIVSAVR